MFILSLVAPDFSLNSGARLDLYRSDPKVTSLHKDIEKFISNIAYMSENCNGFQLLPRRKPVFKCLDYFYTLFCRPC